jgi:acyl carrier protein
VIACTEDGGPHANRRLYVVDRALNLVPRGVAGELLIGGEPGTLAEGYRDRPGLTAERFADDPFHPGGRVFRSGRRARWNADLRLEPLGSPDDQAAAPDPAEPGPGDTAPRTPTERTIVGIFGEVLDRPGVSAEDNFFDIGGNSLKAMLAVSRIKKTFGIKLSVRTLYGGATVRTVAAVVDERKAGEPV